MRTSVNEGSMFLPLKGTPVFTGCLSFQPCTLIRSHLYHLMLHSYEPSTHEKTSSGDGCVGGWEWGWGVGVRAKDTKLKRRLSTVLLGVILNETYYYYFYHD